MGSESICYANSKKDFIREAYRVLKDNGRLNIGDGFASREHYEGKDAWLMKRWMDGWFVNNLITLNSSANMVGKPDSARRFIAM